MSLNSAELDTPILERGDVGLERTDGASASDTAGERPVRRWGESIAGPAGLAFYIAMLTICGFFFMLPGFDLSLQIVFGSLSGLSFLFLFLTHQIDPGVIPPSSVKDPTVAAVEENRISSMEAGMWRGPTGTWVRAQGVSGEERMQQERYCSSCNIWRPPRASHCNTCGYCFERFDHHCGAMGTCVAKGNHRFFVAFLFCSSSACILLLVTGCMQLHYNGFPTQKDEWGKATTYILCTMILVVGYSSFIWFFAMSHCAMLLCDVTSKQLACSQGSGGSSHQCTAHVRGIMTNLGSVCCGPVLWKHRTLLNDDDKI
ncbi:hypothetical protein CYMTET_37870 [Cymbomonas tetramitiformis]|uniref:S-acyltransferase n=1 Tax=Cymbomonas tetramitiformis TaxID=36881 RepID=A0AAE0CFA7_9CHLO|nr:hypothetical protein CYMTET_37870 [Cymbomonas tetramitiformis]